MLIIGRYEKYSSCMCSEYVHEHTMHLFLCRTLLANSSAFRPPFGRFAKIEGGGFSPVTGLFTIVMY